MKILIISILTIFISLPSFSQNVGIGTDIPNSSAMLEIKSTNSGILIPKLTLVQRNAIVSPASGLLIFQTDNIPGFYYYSGTAWNIIWFGASTMTGSGSSGQVTFWTNSSSSTISGDNALFWDNTNKRLGIGIASPNEKLTVNGAIAIAEIAASPAITPVYGKLYTLTADSQLWYKDDAGVENQITYDYAIFEEQYTAGTNAGTFTSGAWRTRNINYTAIIKGNSISQIGSTISLTAGTYRITGSAPAYRVSNHKTKFMKSTGETVIVGTSEFSLSGNNSSQTSSFIDGIFTIASTTSFLFQHRCQTTRNTDGLGVASNFGEVEVFARIYIQRIR